MSEARYQEASVDLAGIVQMLGDSLYSRPEVAVRELIQNASDAILRRRIELGDEAFSPAIALSADPGAGTITVEDNGAGLTDAEIETHLARIGAGATRGLRAASGDLGLIGKFGLGFLTAYMIGRKVELFTTPAAAPGRGFHFVSDNGLRYIVTETAPGPVGARVVVHLNDACRRFAEPDRLEDVVAGYCRLMTTPIRVQGGPPINLEPPWRAAEPGEPELRRRRRGFAFAERLEPTFEPLCVIAVDAPAAQGLLWLHDASTYGGADNRWLQVYVRGMMVARNKRELLPAWAGFVSGAVESAELSPTTSREDVKADAAFEACRAAVQEALIAGLRAVAEREPETWRTILRRHNQALLGAAIADPRLFEALRGAVTAPTTEGDLTLPEIARRSPDGLVLAPGDPGAVDVLVARALGRPAIYAERYGAAAMARAFAEAEGLEVVEIGSDAGRRALFRPERPSSPEAEARLRALFSAEDLTVAFARFEPEELSCVALIDQEQALKSFYESDEAERRIGAGVLQLARSLTEKIAPEAPTRLVLNLAAPLIAQLADAATPPPRAAAAAAALRAHARLATGGGAVGAEGHRGAIGALNAALGALLTEGEAHG